jgi:hypothetical protein
MFPQLEQAAPGNMVTALNAGADWAIRHTDPDYLGFIGDDHRFRTAGWDDRIIAQLNDQGGGFAYGNDLFWPGGEIPTQIFLSSEIVAALGWMGLPECHHLYIDNVWGTLGREIGKLAYLPDVVIEHMHPAGGKAVWDEGHLRVNTDAMFSHDRDAFEAWVREPLG